MGIEKYELSIKERKGGLRTNKGNKTNGANRRDREVQASGWEVFLEKIRENAAV